MKVYKFGGASLKDAEGVRRAVSIIARHLNEPIFVIASAMGKTTNQLEILAQFATEGKASEARNQIQSIKNYHLNILKDVADTQYDWAKEQLELRFAELERITEGVLLLEDAPPRIFDRIMAFGELMATEILVRHLEVCNFPCLWLDARNFMITDANFKSAELLYDLTQEKILTFLKEIDPDEPCAYVVQGYIASSKEGKTTTLGREGSDFTASVFGSVLNSEEVTVWKDVPGIMSGDPKVYPQSVKLDALSYDTAAEMTFFGAGVLHPKTIYPLRKSGINLRVKSYLNSEGEGTMLKPEEVLLNEKAYILKKNQTLLTLHRKDSDTLTESHLSYLFEMLSKCDLNPTLVQRSALNLRLVTDDLPDRIYKLEDEIVKSYRMKIDSGHALHTFINYDLSEIPMPVRVLLLQKEGETVYLLGGEVSWQLNL